MKKQIDSLEEFHISFKDTVGQYPQLLLKEGYDLRHQLMHEENNEYLQACKDGDLVEIADALGDQLYVLCGTIIKHGMQNVIEEVFDRIHKSNMSKLDDNGNPIINGQNGVYDLDKPLGKFLKSVNYKKVDLTDLFNPQKSNI